MSAAKSFPSFLLLESIPQFPTRPNADSRATRTAPCISCVKGAKRSPDDYRATLKSLNSRGRVPRKSLGQHYMLNNDVNERLVGVASVRDGDVVLEIGPGTGSLTNVLVNAGASVLAIEKDPHMAAILNERFSGTSRLQVLREDFVRCHFHSHLSALLVKSDVKSAKVVSNIPFNISTDVIKQILPLGDIISEVVLLLQEETALRLVMPSLRTSEYRPINIFVNFYSVPEYQFNVPRTDFFPQPKVDAAVVTFKLKQAANYPAVSSVKSFFSLVNSAFNGKRKMLRKSLQHLCTAYEIEKALEDIGLPVTSRPEKLTIDDFVKLHNSICKAELLSATAFGSQRPRLEAAEKAPGPQIKPTRSNQEIREEELNRLNILAEDSVRSRLLPMEQQSFYRRGDGLTRSLPEKSNQPSPSSYCTHPKP